MEIKILKKRPSFDHNKGLIGSYSQFDKLLMELRKKELSQETVISVNNEIDLINSGSESEKLLRKQIEKAQSSILKLIEKEHKLVTKYHYRNTWFTLGMVFGVPFGVPFGISLGNMGLIGIGIPIGMVIGMAVGSGMDKKAFEEGRQIDLEIK